MIMATEMSRQVCSHRLTKDTGFRTNDGGWQKPTASQAQERGSYSPQQAQDSEPVKPGGGKASNRKPEILEEGKETKKSQKRKGGEKVTP